jgi:ribonuclease D
MGDIPYDEKHWILSNCKCISIDTETTGLSSVIDKLCLIQIYAPKKVYIVQYDSETEPYNLISLLESNIIKIFHHATFDICFLTKNLNIRHLSNIKCTKIAAKILYGIEKKNSLNFLLNNHLGISLDKRQQLSDWTQNLTSEQINYAANDVIYLIDLWSVLENKLKEQDLLFHAQKCFDFVPIQAYLINKGIRNIFEY